MNNFLLKYGNWQNMCSFKKSKDERKRQIHKDSNLKSNINCTSGRRRDIQDHAPRSAWK